MRYDLGESDETSGLHAWLKSTKFDFFRRFWSEGRVERVSMGWWHLRLSAKILAFLRLSANFFQLRLTKKLKINFFVSKS